MQGCLGKLHLLLSNHRSSFWDGQFLKVNVFWKSSTTFGISPYSKIMVSYPSCVYVLWKELPDKKKSFLGFVIAKISSSYRSISPGCPGPMKVLVLSWARGQAYAELGRKNISHSLPFCLGLPFQFFFLSLWSCLRQEFCFHLAIKAEICPVENTDIEESIYFPVHLHFILSL